MKKIIPIALLAIALTSCGTQSKVKKWNSNSFSGYHGGKNIKCRHMTEDVAKEQTEWIFKMKID